MEEGLWVEVVTRVAVEFGRAAKGRCVEAVWPARSRLTACGSRVVITEQDVGQRKLARWHDQSDLLQGTVELLVPKTLSLEPMHGWGISTIDQTIVIAEALGLDGSWMWTTDMISSELPLPRSGTKGIGSAMLACPAGLRNRGRSLHQGSLIGTEAAT